MIHFLFWVILHQMLPIFRIYVLWCKHKVFSGISDIFPRQTIWDLLKFFCRRESKLSFSKGSNSEIIQSVVYFPVFWVSLHQILQVLEIHMLLYKHKVLCGISDIFPRQTIRDLLKIFCRWESKLSFSKYTKSKITDLCCFSRDLYSFISNIASFRVYVLWYKH